MPVRLRDSAERTSQTKPKIPICNVSMCVQGIWNHHGRHSPGIGPIKGELENGHSQLVFQTPGSLVPKQEETVP